EEDAAADAALRAAVADPAVDLVAFERDKIKGAVRTDFILSAEIIVIALGTVSAEPLVKQVGVLVGISVLMTVGVYGLVAGIVKIDDAGLWLQARASAAARAVGRFLLRFAPWLMKALSVLGTAAMFLVGGHIFVANIAPLHHAVQDLVAPLGGLAAHAATLVEALAGMLAGALVLLAVEGVRRVRR
ncbi:MAG: DUF808 family protein, partial [Lysobacteraceae bacterium]